MTAKVAAGEASGPGAIRGLDHVNISTPDVAGSAAFFARVLGLTPASAPMGIPADQGLWLCDDNGHAIIHLRRFAADGSSTGPIHHVAFTCTGKAGFIAHLTACGVEFGSHDDVANGLSLIVLRDPHGISLELNFAGECAAASH